MTSEIRRQISNIVEQLGEPHVLPLACELPRRDCQMHAVHGANGARHFARPACPPRMLAQLARSVCPPCLPAMFARPTCLLGLLARLAHLACLPKPTSQISSMLRGSTTGQQFISLIEGVHVCGGRVELQHPMAHSNRQAYWVQCVLAGRFVPQTGMVP